MYSTSIASSLFLIAIGAVLAFAVNLQTTGVDLNAVGAILTVVGLIGLLHSFLMLSDYEFPWRARYDEPALPPRGRRHATPHPPPRRLDGRGIRR